MKAKISKYQKDRVEILTLFNQKYDKTGRKIEKGLNFLSGNDNDEIIGLTTSGVNLVSTLINNDFDKKEKKRRLNKILDNDESRYIPGYASSAISEKIGNSLGTMIEKKRNPNYEKELKEFIKKKNANKLIRPSELMKKIYFNSRPVTFETIKKSVNAVGGPKNIEKKLLFNTFKTSIGKFAGPLGIIASNYGEFLGRTLYKRFRTGKWDTNNMTKDLREATGSTIGGLIGFGLGTALLGPVGGIILSAVGSSVGEFVSNKLAKKKAAIGISRVPYDNFPALLHEGESVLTKRETSNMRTGFGGISIAKLSDTIIVREDADIDRIANTLVSRIKQAAINMA